MQYFFLGQHRINYPDYIFGFQKLAQLGEYHNFFAVL